MAKPLGTVTWMYQQALRENAQSPQGGERMKLRRFLTMLHEQARLPEPTKPAFEALGNHRLRRACEPQTVTLAQARSIHVLLAIVSSPSVGYAGYRMNVDPVATVSLDFNPSLEFRVNRFGRVIDAVSSHPIGETPDPSGRVPSTLPSRTPSKPPTPRPSNLGTWKPNEPAVLPRRHHRRGLSQRSLSIAAQIRGAAGQRPSSSSCC
ncbi:MAG: hypothetical protein MZU97_01485 [Bacillus subtilis]|nr:hypothetical protein [Bacillus subtilis]